MTRSSLRRALAGALLAGGTLGALAAPAGAAWWGNGYYQPDYRYQNWNDRYYNGYSYRSPPVVYSTPYNYGYVPPPVIYNGGPGFSITIRP